MDLAYGWADRVAVLCRGRVMAFGPTDEIFRRRDLLDTAKLRGPWVVDLSDALRAAGVWPTGKPLPRSPDALLERLATWRGPE